MALENAKPKPVDAVPGSSIENKAGFISGVVWGDILRGFMGPATDAAQNVANFIARNDAVTTITPHSMQVLARVGYEQPN